MVWGSDARRRTYRKKAKKAVAIKPVDKRQDKQIAKLVKDAKADDSFAFIFRGGISLKTFTNLVLGDSKILLNGLSQGVATGQRLGDVIVMKHLSIRIAFNTNVTDNAGEIMHPIRVLVYTDKDPDLIATPRDRLFEPDIAGGPDDVKAFYAPINRSFRDTYVVHYDKTFPMNSQTSNGLNLSNIAKFMNIKIPLKSHNKVQYQKGTINGAPNNMVKNALWLVVFQSYDDGVGMNVNYTLTYSQ